MNRRIRLSLVGVLCLMLVSTLLIGCGRLDGSSWETYNQAGGEAYEKGNYAEADKQWSAAVKIAEEFSLEDPRLAINLNNLAVLYRAQGKYAEAEQLHQRSLAIYEKARGPDHPDVATVLENYADLLSKTGRADEAAKMEARAQAIRAKQSEQDRAQ